jgi:hypothetical protein
MHLCALKRTRFASDFLTRNGRACWEPALLPRVLEFQDGAGQQITADILHKHKQLSRSDPQSKITCPFGSRTRRPLYKVWRVPIVSVKLDRSGYT